MKMETTLQVLEIINYIATIILVIVAIIGLQQLKISKETRKITSKREAFKIAAEQCNFYLEKIIPEINKLNKVIEKKELDFFSKSQVNIDGEKISVVPYTENDSIERLIDKGIDEVMTVSNLLESFSLYFVSGVASEEVGFNTVGNTFVYSVKNYLPFYISMSNSGAYKHTLSLFVNWNNKIELEKLNKEKDKIEKKLKGSKTVTIKTIGTE
ncbi:hypothetical protein ACFSQ0_07375 [Mesonia sediminis]|uniref:Uncharacterized protein n=1 Tax=Mesonia sediminis TaxID=1703946 RepID=A0ABW5SDV3_9FLAO